MRQTRSPAQALGNDWRHMRQCLILASAPNSGRVDLCLDRIRTPRHGPRDLRSVRIDGYGGVSVDPRSTVGRRNRADAAEALPLTDVYVCPGSANSRAGKPIRWGVDARQNPSKQAGAAHCGLLISPVAGQSHQRNSKASCARALAYNAALGDSTPQLIHTLRSNPT